MKSLIVVLVMAAFSACAQAQTQVLKVVQPGQSASDIAKQGGGDLSINTVLGVGGPDIKLPVKITAVSIVPEVALMTKSFKVPLAQDAVNRKEAQAMADVFSARFADEMAAIGVTFTPKAEAAIDLKLFYWYSTDRYYQLIGSATLKVNDKVMMGYVIGHQSLVPIAENLRAQLVQAAARKVAEEMAKNIVFDRQQRTDVSQAQ